MPDARGRTWSVKNGARNLLMKTRYITRQRDQYGKYANEASD